MTLTEEDKREILTEINELGRKFWRKWRDISEDMMPPTAYVLTPDGEGGFEVHYDHIKMPPSLEQRKQRVQDFGHRMGQRKDRVLFFFLVQEAWKKVLDKDEQIPGGPVEDMPGAQEILVCVGESVDRTQMQAEQDIINGALGETSFLGPESDINAALISPFWDGYNGSRN